MTTHRTGRPGTAVLALLVILVITAAWWALALWPAGATEPEWLTRTRGACFGSMPGGLPNAGGWVLLIGEPIGMFGILWAVWGDSLRADWARLRTSLRWATAVGAVVLVAVAGIAASGFRAAQAAVRLSAPIVLGPGEPVQVGSNAPTDLLVDQNGATTSLAALGSEPIILTFAFGHCATVCPTIVHDLHSARQRAGRDDVPIVILTVDPWRDVPERLPSLSEHWAMGPGDMALSGEIAVVQRVLDTLGIGRQRNETTGDVDHSITVMLLNKSQIVWRVEGGASRVEELLRNGW